MADYASLAIGAISGAFAFLVITIRMNRKLRDLEKERKWRNLQRQLPFDIPKKDAQTEPELMRSAR